MKVRRLCAFAALLLLARLSATADTTDMWLAKARAYLGSESALNAVNSLHFEGAVEATERVADPADSSKVIERPIRLAIDIVFQKPMQQRQIIRSEKVERTTSLDGSEAWERVSDRTNQNLPRIQLLDLAGIKRLRATTIENLSFYSNQGHHMRQVRLLGDATVDEIACVKLSFTHTSNIVFIRYFEKSTGRLVKTELDSGGEIREQGEMMVNGIRFPRKVVNKTADGNSTIISFDKVTVNERFTADTFAVPPIPTR